MTEDEVALARAVGALFRRLRELNGTIMADRTDEGWAAAVAGAERAKLLEVLPGAVRRLPVPPWVATMERGA